MQSRKAEEWQRHVKTRDNDKKLNQRDDESNWGTLLLSLAFLAAFVLLSFLSAAFLLPRADPISHTHKHTPCHTRNPVGQLQSQYQNIIHMAISSPPPPRLLSFSFTTSRLVKVAHAHSHGHSHKHSPQHGCTHWLLHLHRQTERW